MSEQQSTINVTDPRLAPSIFFDAAPAIGATPGVIRITLVERRELMRSGEPVIDLVAVGYLRCTVEGAVNLRDAIDGALLLAEPAASDDLRPATA